MSGPTSAPSRIVIEALAPRRRRRPSSGQAGGGRAGHGGGHRVRRRPRPAPGGARCTGRPGRRPVGGGGDVGDQPGAGPLGGHLRARSDRPDHRFQVRAWIDHRATWRDALARKVEAGVDRARSTTRASPTVGSGPGTPPPRPASRSTSSTSGRCSPTWYELFPRSLPRGRRPTGARRSPLVAVVDRARRAGRPRLRRGLPAAHPPHRHLAPQGPRQHRGGRTGRPGQPLGHRRARRRPRRHPSRPGRPGRLQGPGVGRGRAPDGRGARPGLPVLTRSPLGHRAPRLVPPPSRRVDPVRREPAQALPGHLPARLRDPGLARAVGRAGRRHPVLVRAGGQRLPGGQPPHQAVRLLGVADRRDPPAPSRPPSSWPRRSRAPPSCTAWPRSGSPRATPTSPGGTSAVELRRVLHRAGHAAQRGRAAPQRLAHHPRHPARAPPARAAGGVRRAAGAGRHPVAQLRRVRPELRAGREPARGRRPGGAGRLGEVPGPHAGT